MSTFLKKELEEAGFIVKEVYPEILSIEDFITQDEINEILNIISLTPEEDWHIEYFKNLKDFCMKKFGRDDVDNLVAEGKFEITQNWKDKNFNIDKYPIQKNIFDRINNIIYASRPDMELSGLATLQRMQPGVELLSHTDQHTDPSIQYATILYINDDYSDGELFFKKINMKIKPKPGTLLIFPGNDEYEHGVMPVGPGSIRYVLTGFIKIKDFYTNNKYDNIYDKGRY